MWIFMVCGIARSVIVAQLHVRCKHRMKTEAPKKVAEPFALSNSLDIRPNCQPGVHDGPKVATPGDRLVNGAGVFTWLHLKRCQVAFNAAHNRLCYGREKTMGPVNSPRSESASDTDGRKPNLLALLRWAIDSTFETDRLPVRSTFGSGSAGENPAGKLAVV
jgi:hypothetical protein